MSNYYQATGAEGAAEFFKEGFSALEKKQKAEQSRTLWYVGGAVVLAALLFWKR